MRVRDVTPLTGSQIEIERELLLRGDMAEQIRAVLGARGVIFFRGLDLDDSDQRRLAHTLGTVVANEGSEGIYKISLDSQVNQKADYLKGSLFWHFDGSLQPYPNRAAILRAIKLSDRGGQTEFCNTYAAYEDLADDEKRALASLRVVHSAVRSQFYVNPEMSYEELAMWQRAPSKTCPLVWTHQSGRKSLLLGATADYVEGMTVEASRALLARLRDWATQARYVYRHDWQVGDLLIWDNTGTMHRALPYAADSGRLMHRTILAGEEALV